MTLLKNIARHQLSKGIVTLLVAAVGTAAIMMANSGPAEAGSTVFVGQKVSSGSQVSMDKIDHSTWDTLLRKYVDDNGFVNYKSWHASSLDRPVRRFPCLETLIR